MGAGGCGGGGRGCIGGSSGCSTMSILHGVGTRGRDMWPMVPMHMVERRQLALSTWSCKWGGGQRAMTLLSGAGDRAVNRSLDHCTCILRGGCGGIPCSLLARRWLSTYTRWSHAYQNLRAGRRVVYCVMLRMLMCSTSRALA